MAITETRRREQRDLTTFHKNGKTEQGRARRRYFHFLCSVCIRRNDRKIPSNLQPIRSKIKVKATNKNLKVGREIVLKSPIITLKFECTFKGSKT